MYICWMGRCVGCVIREGHVRTERLSTPRITILGVPGKSAWTNRGEARSLPVVYFSPFCLTTMKAAPHLVLLFLSVSSIAGCASSNRLGVGDSELKELLTVLDTALPDSYGSTRARVVGTLSTVREQQATLVGSPAARVKKVITTVGVVLGLGGTISSFIIKDENTSASIAQASSTVGGVTGIIGLIPFGSGAEKARAVHGYLGPELVAFQERWPQDSLPSDAQWSQFIGDSVRMVHMVEFLNQ